MIKATKAFLRISYYNGFAVSFVVTLVTMSAIGGFKGYLVGVLLGAWSLAGRRLISHTYFAAKEVGNGKWVEINISPLEK